MGKLICMFVALNLRAKRMQKQVLPTVCIAHNEYERPLHQQTIEEEKLLGGACLSFLAALPGTFRTSIALYDARIFKQIDGAIFRPISSQSNTSHSRLSKMHSTSISCALKSIFIHFCAL